MTVSRTLRSPEKVSEATRERVHSAIRTLGYVPNLIAGSLASRRTNLVAVLVPNFSNPLSAVALRGLSDVLHRQNMHLMVASSDHSFTQEEELLRTFLGQRPCGLVLHETVHSTAARELLLNTDITVIETGDLVDDPIDLVVSYPNFAAAKAAGRHLAERGYSKIALVVSPLSARADQRRAGFEAGLAEFGLSLDPERVMEAEVNISGGVQVAGLLMKLRPRIDAVFFTANSTAIGAVLECQRQGWRVPSRLAMITFDDTELAQHTVPSLTSVVIPRYEIGVRAAELLLSRLGGHTLSEKRFDLGFGLIQREST